MWATIISNYFKMGLYTVDNVKVFVAAKWITTEQHKTITGEDYNV